MRKTIRPRALRSAGDVVLIGAGAGQTVAILFGIAVAALVAWVVPLSAVILIWPVLFFVPGWVVIRRVVPDLPVPGAVGAAIVTSVYASAHLVNVVARVD